MNIKISNPVRNSYNEDKIQKYEITQNMCDSLHFDYVTSDYKNIPSSNRIGMCISIDMRKSNNIKFSNTLFNRLINCSFYKEACDILYECYSDLSSKRNFQIEYYKNKQFMACMLIKSALEVEGYEVTNDIFNSIVNIVLGLFRNLDEQIERN